MVLADRFVKLDMHLTDDVMMMMVTAQANTFLP